MVFGIERDVYCHHLTNPPAYRKVSDINLAVTNFGPIEIAKKGVPSDSNYSIKIPDAESIGFQSQEQTILNNEFNNFILAINLVLQTVCVTTKSSTFSDIDMKYSTPQQTSYITRVKIYFLKIFLTSVDIQEHVRFQEKLNIGFIHPANLDGTSVESLSEIAEYSQI